VKKQVQAQITRPFLDLTMLNKADESINAKISPESGLLALMKICIAPQFSLVSAIWLIGRFKFRSEETPPDMSGARYVDAFGCCARFEPARGGEVKRRLLDFECRNFQLGTV
jgi:hypothetical protein